MSFAKDIETGFACLLALLLLVVAILSSPLWVPLWLIGKAVNSVSSDSGRGELYGD